MSIVTNERVKISFYHFSVSKKPILDLFSWKSLAGSSSSLLNRQTVWPDLAKFRHFGKKFNRLWQFCMAYLVLGKILNQLLQLNVCYLLNFLCCKWPKLKTLSSHLVTLPVNLDKEIWSKNVTRWRIRFQQSFGCDKNVFNYTQISNNSSLWLYTYIISSA